MGATMTTIEIEESTAEMLKAKAEASGLSLDDYLRLLAESDAPNQEVENVRFIQADNVRGSGTVMAVEIDRILDELAQGGERSSPLPVNFSREDIYFEHD